MALSLDDKLLGEKTQYYCSSSEEEEGEEDEDTQPEQPAAATVPEPEFRGYGGTCTNTGPKGVINDWRQFKKLETEKREEAERERKALLQKLSMTCRSHLDDETEKSQDEQFLQQIEREMEEFEDEFMKEYREKRIEEMRKALGAVPKFGRLHSLSPGDFTDAIDKENPGVTVIVHLYEDRVSACESMNSCLQCLAQEYPTVKFCRMRASDAKLSIKFALSGVPALLVYKNKELIGNFIRLSDEFGSEIFASDVESFLDEHGFLPNKDVSKAIRDSTTGELRSRLPGDSLSDSDYDVD